MSGGSHAIDGQTIVMPQEEEVRGLGAEETLEQVDLTNKQVTSTVRGGIRGGSD